MWNDLPNSCVLRLFILSQWYGIILYCMELYIISYQIKQQKHSLSI